MSGCVPPSPLRVGIIGGGQLGRMLSLEAPRLNLSTHHLDLAGCPASLVVPSEHLVVGPITSAAGVAALAARVDVLTVEIEHVDVSALAAAEAAHPRLRVRPSARVVALIQDKLVQKDHFRAAGVPLGPFVGCATAADVRSAAARFGLPLMLKSRRGGYDGRGNAVVRRAGEAEAAFASLGGNDPAGGGVYAEKWVPYEMELAVMVVRCDAPGRAVEVRSYPAVTAVQKDSVCVAVVWPATCPAAARTQAEAVARRAVDCLGAGAAGVFGVELFLTADGDVLLNEVAPRPHNTGHYTQDACAVSQFENHLRAVCGMEIGDTAVVAGAAAMVNVLGAPSGTMADTLASSHRAGTLPGATVHWYGKAACRPGRKMGHINLTASSPAELYPHLRTLLEMERLDPRADAGLPAEAPLAAVIMGSDSDLPCMADAVRILRSFGVPTEVDVVSAHRTPDKLIAYGRSAAGRGIRVIVAGAGGAAHLPGMVAAVTPLPVVGVPIKTSTLSGQDSLLSIVQMPRGIPVATVAIGNATNAGLLAVRILAASRPELLEKMVQYQDKMRGEVEKKSERLLELGCETYLEGMANKEKSVNV